ncbi:MAG: copper chaperone PCu(A)C [Gammaproteobacteria bacterium]|nr:copper chaperone PCu(A)C [Gammaproteobacteria bacterium]
MKLISSIITCFFLIFLLTNSAFSAENIHVLNAWIREAPPTIKVMAGYLDIENSSDKELILLAAESDEYERIEFHHSQIENGVAKMHQQDEIIIARNSTFSFTPAGFHLMMFNPSSPMREGKLTSIKLIFKGGDKEDKTHTFEAMVKRSGATESHEHHH